jgi:transposase-like protein
MQERQRRSFTEDYKRQAVELVVSAVARSLLSPPSSVWRHAADVESCRSFSTQRHST